MDRELSRVRRDGRGRRVNASPRIRYARHDNENIYKYILFCKHLIA